MLWAYDDAIVKDMSECINPDGGASNAVKMMGDEGIMGIIAQLQEDKIKLPAMFLSRHPETPLDKERFNFSRLHKGVPAAYDPVKNNIYLEKAVPIQLKYDLHVLTTTTADMDELIRELIFRYSSMYFLTMQVPYESKRNISFGIAINPDMDIRRSSGNAEYVASGKIFESVIELDCQGAVLLSYTPRHMQGVIMETGVKEATTFNKNEERGV